MQKENRYAKTIFVLDKDQKKQFQKSLPDKVFRTERNISIIVAMTQLCMIILFLVNKNISFEDMRTVG